MCAKEQVVAGEPKWNGQNLIFLPCATSAIVRQQINNPSGLTRFTQLFPCEYARFARLVEHSE
jgi:hypothetical protein